MIWMCSGNRIRLLSASRAWQSDFRQSSSTNWRGNCAVQHDRFLRTSSRDGGSETPRRNSRGTCKSQSVLAMRRECGWILARTKVSFPSKIVRRRKTGTTGSGQCWEACGSNGAALRSSFLASCLPASLPQRFQLRFTGDQSSCPLNALLPSSSRTPSRAA
jgi:hypothetical protein